MDRYTRRCAVCVHALGPSDKNGKQVYEMEGSWKQRAQALFYDGGKSIEEIAKETGVSRKSISGHLRSTAGYLKERMRRKEDNAKSRQEYKREWDRKNRSAVFTGGKVTAETIRREHDVAAVILSREKYR